MVIHTRVFMDKVFVVEIFTLFYVYILFPRNRVKLWI